MKKHLTILIMAVFLTTVFTVSFPAKVLLAREEPGTVSFTDIAGHWAEEDILSSYKQGIMNGLEAGAFAPEGQLSRVQLAELLYRVFELDLLVSEDNELGSVKDYYTDVEDGQWYSQAVWNAGRFSLLGDSRFLPGDFRPNDAVNRFEVAVAISKCIKIRGLQVALALIVLMDDLEEEGISSEEKSAAILMHQSGIMQGYDSKFYGAHFLTRAEAAVIFNRCFYIVDSNVEENDANGILVGSGQCSKAICGWAEDNKENEGLYKKNLGKWDAYFFSMGQKPSGGYGVELTNSSYGVEPTNSSYGRAKWIVDLKLIEPGPDMLVITVITYPYEVFAVPAGQEVKARIVDEKGQVLKDHVLLKDLPNDK